MGCRSMQARDLGREEGERAVGWRLHSTVDENERAAFKRHDIWVIIACARTQRVVYAARGARSAVL